MAKIGFIVKSDNHDSKSWDFVLKLCDQAHALGHEVQIMAMMTGVYHLLQTKDKKEEPSPKRLQIEKIMDRGAKISVFGVSAQERGFESSRAFIDGVKMVSMTDMANMVGNCDRIICI